jgi:hypothetical protein
LPSHIYIYIYIYIYSLVMFTATTSFAVTGMVAEFGE